MSSIQIEQNGRNRTIPLPAGETLLSILRRAGYSIPAACGGKGRCGKCRVPTRESAQRLSDIGFPFDDPADLPVLYRAGGCTACSGTGYRGRIAVHEIMTMTEQIEHMVVAQETGTAIRQVALAQRSEQWHLGLDTRVEQRQQGVRCRR